MMNPETATKPVDAPEASTAENGVAPPGGDSPSPDKPSRYSIRPLLLRLHFYAGLFVGPFLLVAAITGLIYTAMPTVEKLVYQDVLTVPASDRSVPLSQQVQAARSAYPEGSITKVTPAAGPTDSTRVVLDVPGLEEGYGRTVFVNPHDGEVLGALRTYGDWLPIRAWSDELHRTLLLGDTGRLYSELAASWLWVIALAGLVLWIQRRRRSGKSLWRPDKGATGRRRLVSWHGTIGITIIAGLLVLSATGLTWSKHAGANVSELRAGLSWETPAVDPGPAASGGGEHAGHGGPVAAGAPGTEAERVVELNRVVTAAAEAGLTGPLDVTLPSSPEGRFQVKENKRSWPVRQDSVAIEGSTGEVTDNLRFADWPFAAKLARWGIDAHMGLLFGIINQLILAAVAIGLICVIVLGYRMWWKRRPTKSRAVGGRPFPRGTWRHVPWPALLGIGLIAILVGWFIPLLGLSLLGFLAIDAVAGLINANRT